MGIIIMKKVGRARRLLQTMALLALCVKLSGQAVLMADGPGDTYALIASVLAPGYTPIEVPDCSHIPFGRHIDEVFDTALNAYVFRFYLHKIEDSDRCRKFDRQRTEIKAYDKSPDNLLGVEGETVVYSWKFKMDSTFQPSYSFTHVHQLKAVGGPEASVPLFTLTLRKANPDRLELRYAETTEVIETIRYGEVGMYEISIKRVDNGQVLFSYQNDSLRTWKTDADFIRPKWGIYRSLSDADNLKDEVLLFADFRIEEQ